MITEISISRDFKISKESPTTFDYIDEVYKQKAYTPNGDFEAQELIRNLKYGLIQSFDNPLFPKDMFAIRIKFGNDEKLIKLPVLFTMSSYVSFKMDMKSDEVYVSAVVDSVDNMYGVTILRLGYLSNSYNGIDVSPTFDNLGIKEIVMYGDQFSKLWNYIPTLVKNYRDAYMVILAQNKHVYSYVFSIYTEDNRNFFSTIYGAED